MLLEGYTPFDVKPWEAASGGKAIECRLQSACRATIKFTGSPGLYNIDVRYFDQSNGISHFRVFLGEDSSANGTPTEIYPANSP